MLKRVPIWLAVGIMIALLTACNTPGASFTEEPITQEPGIETPAGETPIAQPTLEAPAATGAAGGSETCPAESAGTKLYVSEAGGYCFLYPDTFTLRPSEFSEYEVSIVGPALDDSMEPALAFMIVDVISTPGAVSQSGLTPAAFADAQMQSYAPGVDGEMIRTEGTVAGQPAVIIENTPGQMYGREAYLTANDTLYKLYIAPINNQLPVAQPDADLVWSTVTESLTFFQVPPVELVTAEEVCPQAGEGQQLFIDRVQGYCVLLPASFTADEGWNGVFYGGPELPTLPEYVLPARHVSIAFGWNGFADETDTIDSIANERISVAPDPAAMNRQDITIGGQPAVVLEDTTDPIGQRVALVIYDGNLISALVKPTDFNQWPEAQATVDEVWNLAISSMQFFEAWR